MSAPTAGVVQMAVAAHAQEVHLAHAVRAMGGAEMMQTTTVDYRGVASRSLEPVPTSFWCAGVRANSVS
jgi:hypothetical protein